MTRIVEQHPTPPLSSGNQPQFAWPVIELATDLFARRTGLSGPELHRLFGQYTDALGPYPMGDKPSRWMIFQRGMEALDGRGQRAVLRELLNDWSTQRGSPSEEGLDKLRAQLADGMDAVAGTFQSVLGQVPDWESVHADWRTALDEVDSKPETAIRAARTNLESVCKHICDERGQEYQKDDDLQRLYKATAQALMLGPDQHTEQVIKQILSGMNTTVNGMAGLRNALSDAHGKGKKAARPRSRHARLAVNVGFSLSTFLIETHLANRPAAG
jgi:hypothetical protein